MRYIGRGWVEDQKKRKERDEKKGNRPRKTRMGLCIRDGIK